MSQNELIRPSDYGIKAEEIFSSRNIDLIEAGTSTENKAQLVKLALESRGLDIYGHSGLDEEYDLIRSQFKKFTEDNVSPYAHDWHLRDELIPESIINAISELGVFGLTIPSQYGGLGLDKTSMCVYQKNFQRIYRGWQFSNKDRNSSRINFNQWNREPKIEMVTQIGLWGYSSNSSFYRT